MDSDIFHPDQAAISQVLSLHKAGKSVAGHLSQAVNLLDGRFVKVSTRGNMLRVEALAMEFVRTVIP